MKSPRFFPNVTRKKPCYVFVMLLIAKYGVQSSLRDFVIITIKGKKPLKLVDILSLQMKSPTVFSHCQGKKPVPCFRYAPHFKACSTM